MSEEPSRQEGRPMAANVMITAAVATVGLLVMGFPYGALTAVGVGAVAFVVWLVDR